MDSETKEFFHKALSHKDVAPSLTHDGREQVINNLVDYLFDHPWSDEELQSSIIENLARILELEVPDQYVEDDNDEGWDEELDAQEG